MREACSLCQHHHAWQDDQQHQLIEACYELIDWKLKIYLSGVQACLLKYKKASRVTTNMQSGNQRGRESLLTRHLFLARISGASEMVGSVFGIAVSGLRANTIWARDFWYYPLIVIRI